jgi:prefoldin subunit 5
MLCSLSLLGGFLLLAAPSLTAGGLEEVALRWETLRQQIVLLSHEHDAKEVREIQRSLKLGARVLEDLSKEEKKKPEYLLHLKEGRDLFRELQKTIADLKLVAGEDLGVASYTREEEEALGRFEARVRTLWGDLTGLKIRELAAQEEAFLERLSVLEENFKSLNTSHPSFSAVVENYRKLQRVLAAVAPKLEKYRQDLASTAATVPSSPAVSQIQPDWVGQFELLRKTFSQESFRPDLEAPFTVLRVMRWALDLKEWEKLPERAEIVLKAAQEGNPPVREFLRWLRGGFLKRLAEAREQVLEDLEACRDSQPSLSGTEASATDDTVSGSASDQDELGARDMDWQRCLALSAGCNREVTTDISLFRRLCSNLPRA